MNIRLILLLFFLCGQLTAQTEKKLDFKWDTIATLNDDLGVNGAFSGIHNDAFIVAGGANFPNDPVWEGGEKVWYNTIEVLQKSNDRYNWISVNAKLPRKLAYGASVSTPDGLLCIGGNNSDGTFSEVFLLKWNPREKKIEIEKQPDLPEPLANMQATNIGDEVFVVGGQEENGSKASNKFFSFKNNEWQRLEDLPGPGRIQPVVVSQNNGKANCVYVFSGTHFNPDANDPNQFLTDVYEYNPLQKKWRQKADIPTNTTPGLSGGYIGAAPAVKLGDAHIIIFGGAGGENQLWNQRLELQNELVSVSESNYSEAEARHKSDSLKKLIANNFQNTSFSSTIWAYHAITDTWSQRGEIPGKSPVVTDAEFWNDEIFIAGGEISPGVRTPAVHKISVEPHRADFGLINYITLFVYLALIVGLGWYFSRRNNSTDDYFLAGGRIPWWAAGLSIYATMLSAITYLSQPALAYSYDWQAYLGYFTILLTVPIVITFYLPFFRNLNITTAYEYLEKRFNIAVRIFGSASFVLFQVARMGIVVYLPALALSTVVGLDIYTAIIIMGVLAILYTVLGGIEAVIWTDVIQVIVLIGGLILGLIYIAIDIGDVGYIFETAYADNKMKLFDFRFSWTEVVTWSLFLGSFALNFAPYTTDQAVVQRYLTTANEKESRKSIWLNGIISIPAGLLIFLMGTFLYVFFKDNPDFIVVGMQNDGIFPLFIANHLPPGVAGLVIAGIYSASMSSLDSSMHSVSTVVTVDYYKRFSKNYSELTAMKVAKWVTITVGVIGTAVACLMAAFPIASLFFFFQEVVGLFGSALTGIFILGIFLKRANWAGTLIGALLSVIVVVFLKYQTPINFYIYPLIAIPVCVIGGYLASLMIKVKRNDNSKNLVYHKGLKDHKFEQ
ncbi:cyclically-permuted mutarotase family protein [Salegentibacter agarivorans]|uniref:Cyclically-permuted mutarotase family protein n=1 Tax=Salegentibacter agarivorans TaxID=345907 RepID=A0A1I2JYV6_9FLAO|nr:sodium/solute symporter [Salegentibacter agarivorans]SFF59080.1 cyclically-permuted mutarotase family protein [Salegentibacter agarivorans]